MLSLCLEEKKREILASGYCRESYAEYIPPEILKVLACFYDDAIYWTVSKDEIPSTNQWSQDIIGPSWTMHDCQFSLCLEPSTYGASGMHVRFKIKVDSIPITATLLIVTATLKCYETNTEWRARKKFSRKDIDNEWSSTLAWRSKSLPLARCTDFDSLTFSSAMMVTSIHYEDRQPFLIPIEIAPPMESMRYEWKVDEHLLNEFKTAYNGQLFFSPHNFGPGGNYCLYVAPNGIQPYDEKVCILFIQTLSIPDGYSQPKLTYCMELKELNAKHEASKSTETFVFWPDGTVYFKQLADLTSITFVVTLRVEQPEPSDDEDEDDDAGD